MVPAGSIEAKTIDGKTIDEAKGDIEVLFKQDFRPVCSGDARERAGTRKKVYFPVGSSFRKTTA
jgi:hypothetical protein